MRPILFHIPLSWLNSNWPDLPLYGYGLLLFLAFLTCNWLGQRLCRKQGIDPRFIPDLMIWLFVAGIAGGRLVFVVHYWDNFAEDRLQIFKLWDGGLVLYGALFGGALGYFAYDFFVLQKAGVSKWKMLDVVAPSIALGVALGRIGCLCTGCCFGNVACPDCPAIHFPYGAPAYKTMARQRAVQTSFGFLLAERGMQVVAVEPGSNAETAGLKPGDVLIEVNDVRVRSLEDVAALPPPYKFGVFREGRTVTLTPFAPTSIGLHPTQIYETISMGLLLFFLLSYFPYRSREGELMVYLMLGYGVHRFLNEMLRTDTDPVAFGLTLSQNISVGILIGGAILGVLVWRRGPREESRAYVDPPPAPSIEPAPSIGGGTTEVIQDPKS